MTQDIWLEQEMLSQDLIVSVGGKWTLRTFQGFRFVASSDLYPQDHPWVETLMTVQI